MKHLTVKRLTEPRPVAQPSQPVECFCLGGNMTEEEINALQAENEALRADNQRLTTDYNNVVAERDSFRTENESLTAANNELRESEKKLKETNFTLARHLDVSKEQKSAEEILNEMFK